MLIFALALLGLAGHGGGQEAGLQEQRTPAPATAGSLAVWQGSGAPRVSLIPAVGIYTVPEGEDHDL
jgi:hypothetical protein